MFPSITLFLTLLSSFTSAFNNLSRENSNNSIFISRGHDSIIQESNSLSTENSNHLYDCNSSSSSYKCYSSSFSDDCSSSSSSSGFCDPCCFGVEKLIYQSKFPAGEYLAKVSQKFTVFDVFGPNACSNVGTLANNLGVSAVIVGSDGLDVCYSSVVINNAAIVAEAEEVDLRLGALNVVVYTEPIQDADLTASADAAYAEIIKLSALANQMYNLPLNQMSKNAASLLLNAINVLLTSMESFIAYINSTPTPRDSDVVAAFAEYNPITNPNGLSIMEKNTAVQDAVAFLSETIIASADFTYGNLYDVSRAWSLNSSVYSILDGTVSAANSLYNCYGDYRAIYITKPLSEMTYVYARGDACFKRCKDKPQSCLFLCGGLKPPGYEIPFGI